ncbi:hypothetical protein pb186bvf_012341 [Paramecium bursaria]
MIEYLVVGFCFLALILVRMYLFYRTYDNKMKYYSDPKDLAREFYDNLISQKTEKEVNDMINNLHYLGQRNAQSVQNILQENIINWDAISEKLRNTSLIIALITEKSDEKQTKQRLQNMGQCLRPFAKTFTELTQKLKEQKLKDKALVFTIEKYSDYIQSELSSYYRL